MTPPDRPLRICFIAYRGNMACGGQGIYLWFLARELARLGHSIDVLVGPPYPDPMPFAHSVKALPNLELWGRWFTRDWRGLLAEHSPSTLFEPLNFYELLSSRLGFLPEPFAFSVRAFRELAHRLRRGQTYDLVHDVQCLGWGTRGLHRLGLPIVSTIHHPLTVDRRASFIRDESLREAIGTMQFYPIGMQSRVARRLDRIFTSSEESARTIVRDFGVSPNRIRNVLNGLDTELFSPDSSVTKSENEILCVGRASDPNKGIRTLIEAFAQLPEATQLTLVDNDHPGNEVFQWAQAAGVAARIRVTGRIETSELIHLYRRATAVVVPSRYEGFGLPAVEAMACGTPVVASRAGALPEVIALSEGGLLAERDHPASLAQAVRTLLDQPALRNRLAERGRQQVDAHFSWPRVAAATARGYAEVLSERRGAPERTITSDNPGH
ncbi:glycosyltransferase family 4 protein [Myxococcota bacterium]|nr:glycosyltransferase family 4 protein [Myxococcota bacterium]